MVDWVGTQGLVKVAKKAKIIPIMSLPPEIPKSKTKKIVFDLK